MQDSSIDVAIVGAGPYALSLASHLSGRDVRFRIFGSPMQAWRDMSPGMYLKSLDFATTIYAPRPGHTFVDYCRDRGLSSREPCEIARFAEYGVWAQQQLVPGLEQVDVTGVARREGGFEVTLATGERVRARRVVVATGLTHFERAPAELAALPTGLASHTARHSDFSCFRDAHVLVVGAGQSALQAAALLHENGARAELVVRGWDAYFAGPPVEPRPLRDRLAHPMSVLGPGRLNFFLERVPMGVHYLPEARRVKMTLTHLGPWGAWWLRDRVVGKVPVHPRCRVVGARASGRGVSLEVTQGDAGSRTFEADHVIYGTGFDVDVDRVPFLRGPLAGEISRVDRAPRLSRRFESSVRGLYFIGPASALSFGPLFRFVAGAAYAAPTLAAHLARTRGAAAAAVARVRRPAPVQAD